MKFIFWNNKNGIKIKNSKKIEKGKTKAAERERVLMREKEWERVGERGVKMISIKR